MSAASNSRRSSINSRNSPWQTGHQSAKIQISSTGFTAAKIREPPRLALGVGELEIAGRLAHLDAAEFGIIELDPRLRQLRRGTDAAFHGVGREFGLMLHLTGLVVPLGAAERRHGRGLPNLAERDGGLRADHRVRILSQRLFQRGRRVGGLEDAQRHHGHLADVPVGVVQRRHQGGQGRRRQSHEVADGQGSDEPVLVAQAGHTVYVQVAVEGEAVAKGIKFVPRDSLQDCSDPVDRWVGFCLLCQDRCGGRQQRSAK
jgi:hypothetical protein